MTPERLAEIRARLAATEACGKWWGLGCVDPADEIALGVWLDCGPDDMRDLLAEVDRLADRDRFWADASKRQHRKLVERGDLIEALAEALDATNECLDDTDEGDAP